MMGGNTGPAEIRKPRPEDQAFWQGLDVHASPAAFHNLLKQETARLILVNGQAAGMLWYTLLWHRLPSLNLLALRPEYRGQGLGAQALHLWEKEMAAQGFDTLLVSTQTDESAQAFFRKQGYLDCGGLVLQGTSLDQPLEIFLRKTC